ncbi:hypothetical protein C8J57DRAFT_1381016 [Mycena rebaudengoi]|nr:hypothetical protein C8J57DRAFT_1381016 [Mycena rebaudengoi]
MFGFTAILSISVPSDFEGLRPSGQHWSLLLASQSVVAVPSPSSPSPFLFIRQSANPGQVTIAPQCVNPCTQVNNTVANMTTVIQACTNDVVSQYEACYDCELNALAATLEFLEKDINAFVQNCANLGHPVKSVTIVAKNGGERLSLGISGSVIVGLAALSLVVL